MGEETQEQIDANMNLLINEFPDLFKGIGKAKVPPISFKVKDNAKPVTQKLRPVPINLMAKLKENLDNFWSKFRRVVVYFVPVPTAYPPSFIFDKCRLSW